ncbi:Hypothetical_protein [Hexamita inflata]|uniref:Hypothetical_protein n=1 Tax=Hexamita inflata TaxID=28002 RepID=A0AA86TMA1_9EUKA|nr:Hypothetical protein HINF_LOCUS4758 [Hexamita inflata]
MECYDYYWDCLYAKNDGYECQFYDDLEKYCFFSVENIAWWWWLVLAGAIVMLISFITCCVCCCCKKKKVKYQKIVEIKVPSQEQQSYQVPAQNVQAYQPYQQYQNVQNVQPVMPQMYIPQPVYQPMPTGIPNYNYQYGAQQQNVPYPKVPILQIIK